MLISSMEQADDWNFDVNTFPWSPPTIVVSPLSSCSSHEPCHANHCLCSYNDDNNNDNTDDNDNDNNQRPTKKQVTFAASGLPTVTNQPLQPHDNNNNNNNNLLIVEDCWYSRDELRAMRTRARRLARHWGKQQQQHYSTPIGLDDFAVRGRTLKLGSHHSSIRGLEHLTSLFAARQARYGTRACIHAVLHEQARQQQQQQPQQPELLWEERTRLVRQASEYHSQFSQHRALLFAQNDRWAVDEAPKSSSSSHQMSSSPTTTATMLPEFSGATDNHDNNNNNNNQQDDPLDVLVALVDSYGTTEEPLSAAGASGDAFSSFHQLDWMQLCNDDNDSSPPLENTNTILPAAAPSSLLLQSSSDQGNKRPLSMIAEDDGQAEEEDSCAIREDNDDDMMSLSSWSSIPRKRRAITVEHMEP